jgi:cardiolipin synthase
MMDQPTYRVRKIYDNGDVYLGDLLEAISGATKSIYVESYIFELPEPGVRLLRALEEKHRQGLDIRILIDGVGSLHHIRPLQNWSEDSWIPVRVFNPLPWHRRWRWLFFPLFLLNLIWNTRLLNRRDHRKMIVIDGKRAFLGSINFSKVHFSFYGTRPWFDLAIQVEGELIQVLDHAFLREFGRIRPVREKIWHELKRVLRSKPKLFPIENKLRLNSNFILRFLFWRDLLWRIRRAKKRVYIMNAYFVPHRTLMRSLAVAARRGVEVVVLLPSESDVPVVKWFAPIYYRKLINKGVQIREMQGQMIHTKSVIIDDWALVGSNNMNYRSLIHDLEVEAVVQEPEFVTHLLWVWSEKIRLSRVIKIDEVANLSLVSFIRYRLVLLIRYFV